MTSPALADLWTHTLALPAREKIVGLAWLMLGTPRVDGQKRARPIDGITGKRSTEIDCSGFVRNIFDQVFPDQGLSARDDLNSLKFRTVDLFEDTVSPLPGDIVCWDGHVGIVFDPVKGTFIGAQSSTGVMVASYTAGYWAQRVVLKFRKWKSL
jgi:cell wall-associated NlpC family hydrolase